MCFFKKFSVYALYIKKNVPRVLKDAHHVIKKIHHILKMFDIYFKKIVWIQIKCSSYIKELFTMH